MIMIMIRFSLVSIILIFHRLDDCKGAEDQQNGTSTPRKSPTDMVECAYRKGIFQAATQCTMDICICLDMFTHMERVESRSTGSSALIPDFVIPSAQRAVVLSPEGLCGAMWSSTCRD